MIKFQLRKTFYPFPVYEFNLPAGHSCPFARACKIKVDRLSGKFDIIGDKYRCYAAFAERFPGVRKSRWINYEAMTIGEEIVLPPKATHVRIHGSGDFFSQDYFDRWLEVIRKHPGIKFWAFTKSIRFWVARLGQIPENFTLQASKGSADDYLIDKYGLKFVQVFRSISQAQASGLPIDYDDTLAMSGSQSFALLDNFKFSKKERLPLPRSSAVINEI